MRELTRRRVLAAGAGVAGLGAVSGCLDGVAGDGTDGSGGVQSTFFVFGDVAAGVAGDATDAEILVPVGQHGHGWEPGPRVREAIRDASLLVHGMSGFQPWVDDVVTDLEADGADVTSLDVTADVDLLELNGGHGHDDHDETTHRDDEHDDHDETTHRDDEHDDQDETTHRDDEHGGEYDPHFWLDPLRVRTAVDTVGDALVEVDPGNADAYEANAAAYRRQLDELHEELETTFADASKGTLLVAGHDAFQYLADGYDVEVEALTGLSPDGQPTARDIERAQAVIDRHDLRYVCADPLESGRAADQLVAETDATEVLPLTALPGLHDDWDERGWGYVDVVENVNRPTLERALEA